MFEIFIYDKHLSCIWEKFIFITKPLITPWVKSSNKGDAQEKRLSFYYMEL